jgi:hypothetical protein
MLAIERTTLRRSSQLEVDEKLIKAIALQIGLRRIVAGQPVGHF